MTVFAPVQLATSPKSNHVIWLVIDLASRSVVKPGFSTFGVEVASSTSSPIKLGSLASPNARRLRFLPEVWAVSSVVTVLFAVTPCPAERVGASFLSGDVEAAATLFSGVVASNFGVAAVDVAVAVDVAEAAVLVLLASLVEAGAVEVAAAVTAGLASYVVAAVLVVSAVDAAEVAVAVDKAGASDAVATAATLSLVVSVFSSAAALAAVPTMTSVPNSTEQTPTFNLRIENLLIRSLNKSFPI